MSFDASTLRKLAALHLSAEQMSGVVEILADMQAAEEARKLAQRERARKSRASRDRNVTATAATRDVPRERVTRAEDKTSNSDIEPQEQNRAPAGPSPRQVLETVLDAERAAAILDHRKRIKVPLGHRAAKLLAAELAKCPDPNAAADLMIVRGWRGFEAKWLTEPNSRAGPTPKPMNAQELARNLRLEMEQADEDTSSQVETDRALIVSFPSRQHG